ncbi:MAG TPA: hypothetical protein VGK41_06180 [Solirubrobacterales bacterium]
MFTILRGRWAFLVAGLFTLGFFWFVGALARDSDEPFDWRKGLPGAAAAIVAVFALGLFGARPAPLLGFDAKALQKSVGNGDLLPDRCLRARVGNAWLCSRWESQLSSAVPYRVRMTRFGCWEAVRLGSGGEGGSPKNLSGCVTLVDYLSA